MADISADKPPSTTVELKPIAGFWRRLMALGIDSLILSVPLFLLGLVFFQWAASLGQAGRLIGFGVSLLYFGLLNSKLAGGRTLGKWLLDIRVIDREGKSLSPMRSIVRTLVIFIPFFANGLWFDTDALPAGWPTELIDGLLSFAVFGGLGAIVYLYVFNRRTRQSLHDLAVGSFVVRDPPCAIPISLFTPRLHLIVIGCWLALNIVGPVAGIWLIPTSKLTTSPAPLIELQTAIKAQLGTPQVQVQTGTTAVATIRNGTSSTSFLQITVVSSEGDVEAQKAVIANKVLSLHPDLLGKEILVIVIQRKFDFGLAGWSENYREALDASAWQSKLTQSKPSNF